MKLVGFSIKNYRSISTAYKLPLTNYTVILGPNNEGKSNILRGLGLALTILTGQKLQRLSRSRFVFYSSSVSRFDGYDWEIDYPINLQKEKPNGWSEFVCEFELGKSELEEFKRRTSINLSTLLKVKISVGIGMDKRGVKVDFLMKGKGKASLNKKKDEISQFIREKLILQYIPTFRTSELAIRIVESILERELYRLEDNTEFKNAVNKIIQLQKPIIKEIEKNLKESISEFIPDIKGISIKNKEDIGRLINASCSVYVDDGIETDLRFKGDGVVSLTVISLLQYFSKQGSFSKDSKDIILLLEEPEVHLHPKAIHNLKKALYEISKNHQVILTTHSPIIVERENVKHNIIVQNRQAKPANSIDEIRQSLGIVMSDNLSSAFLVLLVEGEKDAILLKSWMEEKSIKIKTALSNGSLIIDHLSGASNIGYKATLYKNNLCNVIVYLDNDDAGRNAIENAKNKGIIKDNEYVLSTIIGMKNSEIEDLLDINSYDQLIKDLYGVDISNINPKSRNKKWSDKMREIFESSGKIWNDTTKSEIKYKVAQHASKLKSNSLDSHKSTSIVTLIKLIENILNKEKQ